MGTDWHGRVASAQGGTNQLTDNTEIIIPTKRINVSQRSAVMITVHMTLLT